MDVSSDKLARIRELIRSLPAATDRTAAEVLDYLAMVAERTRHVEDLAGTPQLVEPESLRQTYAGLFHRRMFETVQMLDGASVAEILGPVQDIRGYTKRLRSGSTVIAVRRGNTYLYPAFQFDPDHRRVRPVVARINEELAASVDPWGALAWWTAANPRWERRCPVDHPDDEQLTALLAADADDGC
jgi:hypothetical protein